MQQHTRPAPRSASAASNPSTNPERTNNQRESLPQRTRSSVDLAAYTGAGGEPSRAAEGSGAGPQDKESTRLNQIIQHFHTKAALTICAARAQLPKVRNRDGNVKQDRWFNVVLDDTDALLDELQEWKRSDLSSDRPPPLVIEVYVDTANLSQNQALVIADESGKRWDVADALAGSAHSSPRPTNKPGGKFCEVVLERWTVEVGDSDEESATGRTEQLPNVYKKGVVLFRSLYTFLRFLPTWKLYRRLGRHPANGGSLRVKYRVKQGGLASGSQDSLLTPLYPLHRRHSPFEQPEDIYDSDPDTSRYGDDANDLSRHRFAPLLTPAGPLRISLLYRRHCDFAVASAEALLSSRFFGRRESDPTTTTTTATMDRYNTTELGGRAASANVKGKSPFKAGTLASSPRPRLPTYDQGFSPPASSLPDEQRIAVSPATFIKTMDAQKAEIRDIGKPDRRASQKRTSLNTLPQQALRAPPHSLPNETAIASSTSSPMAPPSLSRYQSAFAGRTKRTSSTSQQDKANTSGGSSARGSASDQAASGTRSDDEAIQDFVGLLESDKVKFAKLIKPAARHSVDLSKFSALREESRALADDMSASSLLNQGTTPPSRRLSNVPALSTSSSPRPLGHATHVRSRLSTQSIAEEAGRRGEESMEEEGEGEEPLLFRQDL
ncbi:autophagy protein 13 [Friedmanniomyces endolithicus]|nr:autophagy protein 13 [Friedmanniomyces endolithicus]KAK0298224.1 autophagy protein 13 [Friedmanniomyces endolithicus]KAK1015836.1 autophagy protein 13 [Friedmanniomyces endolithicus]